MYNGIKIIVDSKLRNEMEKNKTLHDCKGYKECLALMLAVVYPGMDIRRPDEPRPLYRNRELIPRHEDCNENNIAYITDPCRSEGGCLKDAIKEASRIEVVIKFSPYGPNAFLWALYTYRKGKSEPFYALFFHVSFDGVVSPSSFEGPYKAGGLFTLKR